MNLRVGPAMIESGVAVDVDVVSSGPSCDVEVSTVDDGVEFNRCGW